MPIYQYFCKDCSHEFEKLMAVSLYQKKMYCEKCGREATKKISTGISGFDKTQEPWEYTSTHKLNPKYIKDSKGHRERFDPTKHTKGRKGSGK